MIALERNCHFLSADTWRDKDRPNMKNGERRKMQSKQEPINENLSNRIQALKT